MPSTRSGSSRCRRALHPPIRTRTRRSRSRRSSSGEPGARRSGPRASAPLGPAVRHAARRGTAAVWARRALNRLPRATAALERLETLLAWPARQWMPSLLIGATRGTLARGRPRRPCRSGRARPGSAPGGPRRWWAEAEPERRDILAGQSSRPQAALWSAPVTGGPRRAIRPAGPAARPVARRLRQLVDPVDRSPHLSYRPGWHLLIRQQVVQVQDAADRVHQVDHLIAGHPGQIRLAREDRGVDAQGPGALRTRLSSAGCRTRAPARPAPAASGGAGRGRPRSALPCRCPRSQASCQRSDPTTWSPPRRYASRRPRGNRLPHFAGVPSPLDPPNPGPGTTHGRMRCHYLRLRQARCIMVLFRSLIRSKQSMKHRTPSIAVARSPVSQVFACETV